MKTDLKYNEIQTVCKGLKKDLESVKLLPSTKIISSCAFSRSKLKEIELNEGLTIIQPEAFYYSDLEVVNFPSTVSYIDNCAFAYTNIKKVDLSKCKNLTLGEYVFYHANIEELILPDNLEEIPEDCFGCNNFKTVNLPNSLISIGVEAFGKCYNLEKIDFKNVKCLNAAAFKDCQNLEEVKFSNCLEEIGSKAFGYCANLKEIDLSNTKLGIINEDTFFDCTQLKELRLPDTLEALGLHCIDGTLITSLNLPDSVDTLYELNSKKKVECFCNDPEKIMIVTPNENGEITLVQKTLDGLIDSGRSFREINSIYKKDVEEIR